jgi:hypothetical protein
MNLKLYALLALGLFISGLSAQTARESNDEIIRCYTVEADAIRRANNPSLGTLEDFEEWLAPRVREYKQNSQNQRAVVSIPIVFHLIHNNDAANLNAIYVNEQIKQLNNDFRKLGSGSNSSPVGADTEIEFCAAVIDPNGNAMAEPGIDRVNRSTAGFTAPPYSRSYYESTIKPNTIWDPNQYCNVWVSDLGGGLLGYAQFPEASFLPGIGTGNGGASTDGVVVLYSSVGSTDVPHPNGGVYAAGRTLTHEIGHWLGLRHIWGDGNCNADDYCDDTPRASGSTSGCPTKNSCNDLNYGASSDPNDMVENYMDYSYDLCMNIFTVDQKARMQAVLANSVRRASLLSSAKCANCDDNGGDNDGDGVCADVDCNDNDASIYQGAPCDDGNDCTFNDVLDSNCNCSGTPFDFDPDLTLTITFDNYPQETSWDIRDINNTVVASGGTYGGQPDGSTLNIPITLSDGNYTFTIYDSYGDGICCSYGIGSYQLVSSGETIASGGSFASAESTQFCVISVDPCAALGGDTDGDGTCDANDGCPNDPNKTAPGDCGCGVADTDSDGDGTADCIDGCPGDPGKTAPGACGCGVADTDSDGDGTLDCNDNCPNDPGKTEPGACGCGTADVDSDGDGALDCNDGCPNDPGKTAPGDCGCGVADTDSDGDGTADCNDGCPNDPGKTAPGDCGCGVVDVDSDGDGTADCADGCPNDPGKTSAGDCGCGVADTDSDGDGTADCIDGCPSDPGKTSPGACGCGTADADSDGDGTLDCNDGCPNDPAKTDPGLCGCGTADADSDGDGVLDCNDVCPGGDDTVDLNGNGIPDACECNPATANFGPNPLTHSGGGSSASTAALESGSTDASFTISNLNAREGGRPANRFIESVTVTYVDGGGATQSYGTFNGNSVSTVNVSITGGVQSITVTLFDSFDGNASNLSVNLSDVSYCSGTPPCADADGDGVCDGDDVCPGFDDNLLGTSCNDGDDCTEGDVYTACGTCAGTDSGDSDGDGVCDALDICPGGDDTVDTDGDGIPDFCDTGNCNEVTDNFSPNPLTHSGAGSSASSVSTGGNTDVSFTISNIEAKLNGRESRKYIEEVSISYVDGNGQTVAYGIFRGDQVSSVAVSIAGSVQSVNVSLKDVYDGSTQSNMSVDMTAVTSCAAGQARSETISNGGLFGTLDVEVYPNPTRGEVFLRLDNVMDNAVVEVFDMLGKRVTGAVLSGGGEHMLDLRNSGLNNQFVIVHISVDGMEPVVKRVMISSK